jgi:hypothetical protein
MTAESLTSTTKDAKWESQSQIRLGSCSLLRVLRGSGILLGKTDEVGSYSASSLSLADKVLR